MNHGSGVEGEAGAERGLAQVGAGPGTPLAVWVGLGTVAVLGLGAMTFSSASPSAAPSDRGPRLVVRTDAPRLDTGMPDPSAPEPIESGCLDPAQQVASGEPPASNEALASEDTSGFDVGLVAELQRQALEAAQRKRELDERRRRSSMVAIDRKPTGRVAFRDDADATPAAAGLPQPDRGALLRGPTALADPDPSREERFARRAALEPVETVRAQRLEHPETVVPQGTLIRGVLETAIQSDLPGFLRAQVSEPVYSFTGQLAVPRGSTLIGRYQSGLVQGQTRVFVIWQRLLRPDGISIQLASPGTDLLGRAGVAGEVNTRFFERFRGSLLLSLVDGSLAIAAAKAQNSDGSTIVNAGGTELQRAADLALQNSVNIPPTIEVARGTPISVFVAKDLDFVDPLQRERPEGG